MNWRSTSVLLLCFIIIVHSDDNYLRPCYFTNWAQYRPGRAKYTPEDYIPGLCTHILFAFGWMNEDFTARAYDPTDLPTDWAGSGLYARVNALKHIDPALRTLLSFGGWSFGKHLFQKMAETSAGRQKFIESAIRFVRKYSFDGIDIDWEYPTAADKAAFTAFFAELLEAAKIEASLSGRPRLLITAAVAAGTQNIVNEGYDIPIISKYLDFVLLMSYDFHGSWEHVTGMNSPLFNDKKHPTNPEWNVAGAANRWALEGMPRSKIIVGIPTYGRGWTLTQPTTQRGVGAPGRTANATPFVRLGGTGAYYEFCEMLANGAERYFDNVTKVPYLIDKDQWFSYEDVESIKYKTDWIKENHFGGAFVWTLDFDDFNGKCPPTASVPYPTTYPLIRVIAAELGAKLAPAPISPLIKTTLPPNYGKLQPYLPFSAINNVGDALNRACYGQVDGFRAMPTLTGSAGDFLLCLRNRGYTIHCPQGLTFNAVLGYCTNTSQSLTLPKGELLIATTTRPYAWLTTKAAPLMSSSQSPTESSAFSCTLGDGFYADPQSCTRFYRCFEGIAHHFNCPTGLRFDTRTSRCDHASQVQCQQE